MTISYFGGLLNRVIKNMLSLETGVSLYNNQCLNYIQGKGYMFGEDKSIKIGTASLLKGIYSIRKEFAPKILSFLSRPLFRRERKQKVAKVVPTC